MAEFYVRGIHGIGVVVIRVVMEIVVVVVIISDSRRLLSLW